MVIPEDIEKLHQVAIELGKRPISAAESIDFIQEQWQVNVLGQDEIDQWVVGANGNGTALRVWHKRLREDKGRS